MISSSGQDQETNNPLWGNWAETRDKTIAGMSPAASFIACIIHIYHYNCCIIRIDDLR